MLLMQINNQMDWYELSLSVYSKNNIVFNIREHEPIILNCENCYMVTVWT